MLQEFFLNPDAFFDRRSEDPGYLGPVLVALSVAVFGIAAAVPFIQFMLSGLPQEAQAFGAFVFGGAVVGGLFGPFIRWLLYSVGFYVVATIAYDPDGQFSDLFALAGWGLVPAIPASIVSGFASFLVYRSATPPQDPQAMARFAQQLQSDPLIVVSGIVGLAFLLWSGLLWTFAVKHALSMREREAAITVAVPLAIAVLLRLYNLV